MANSLIGLDMPLPQLSHDEFRRKLHEKREIGSSPAIPSETCDFLSLGNRYVGSRATVSNKSIFVYIIIAIVTILGLSSCAGSPAVLPTETVSLVSGAKPKK